MQTFISYRRPMRSTRTAVEILVASAVAIGAWAFGVSRLIANPANPNVFGAIGILVGIVAVAIVISQVVAFVRGTEYAVDVTEAGIIANGELLPWASVRKIRAIVRPKSQYAFINIRVRTKYLTALTHLLEITTGNPETALDELKLYLETQSHPIQWELRVLP